MEEAIVRTINERKDNLNHQNSIDKAEVVKNKDNPKSKQKKPTKEEKEKEVIAEFEKDIQNVHTMRKNCGLDLSEIKCKKCNFETHSEGTLRKHKRTVHHLKESNLNIIIGFKADMQHHLVLLEAMEELNKVICERCDFRTNSKGLLKIHDQEQH